MIRFYIKNCVKSNHAHFIRNNFSTKFSELSSIGVIYMHEFLIGKLKKKLKKKLNRPTLPKFLQEEIGNPHIFFFGLA